MLLETIQYIRAMKRVNKRQRNPKGQSRMENPEKLATLGKQDKNK